MTDHHIREAERVYEASMADNPRLEAKISEILPEVMADPDKWQFDVDLMDSKDFLEFLQATLANPKCKDVQDCAGPLLKLMKEYRNLAGKVAEDLAWEALRSEDADRGYNG